MTLSNDRPRGVLAPVDRKYLDGKKTDYSRQAEYQRKKDIVERVRHAILDFRILASENFPEELLEDCRDLPDIEPTFEYDPPTAVDPKPIHPDIVNGLIEMVAFVHRAQPSLYQANLHEGIDRSFSRWAPDTVIEEFTIRATTPSEYAKRAKRDFEEGKHLSDKSIRILLEEGEVDPNRLAEYLESRDVEGRVLY